MKLKTDKVLITHVCRVDDTSIVFNIYKSTKHGYREWYFPNSETNLHGLTRNKYYSGYTFSFYDKPDKRRVEEMLLTFANRARSCIDEQDKYDVTGLKITA